jgi:nicotinamidase-related amidase
MPNAKERGSRKLVRERSPVALLLIDVINDLEFEGGERYPEQLPAFIRRVRWLKRQATKAGIATIYVNDNFGRWRSDLHEIVRHCASPRMRGAPLAKGLAPSRRNYFVLKPRHSAFHSTSLEVLLEYLETRTVIVAGIAGDNCVLFTAADAYMRHLQVHVPADCTISQDAEANRQALELMKRELHVDITESSELNFRQLVADAKK